MSDETQTLDDIFNGLEAEEPAEVIETEEATVDDGATTAQEDSEDEGQPEAVEQNEEQPQEVAEKPHWSETAYKDEKRKRQELERQLEAERAAKQEPVKPPDAIDDPEGYNEYVKGMVGQAEMQATLRVSRAMAKRDDPDFDAKLEKYDELFKAGEVDQSKILSADSPYHAMLEFVNKHERMKKMENIEEWEAQERERIKEEVRKELESEMQSKAEKDQKVSAIKPSIANARSSKATEESYDASLKELLGR